MSTQDQSVDANVYSEAQRKIEGDIKRRSEENQQRVEAIKSQRRTFASGPIPLIMLAVGDSWFDYPLPVLGHTDVADSLQNQAAVKPSMMKLAHYGDATTALMGVTKRQRLVDYLSDPSHGPVDVIMFSGGGNDLVGDQFRFWLNSAADVGDDPTKGVNNALLDDILGVVTSAYLELIHIRDRYAKDAYIVVHAYDFAIPTGIPACAFAGPWLRPSLMEQGWPTIEQGSQIVRTILKAFRASLLQLQNSYAKVVLVDAQGTLQPSDWANELHPTKDGFGKIASKFRSTLQALPEFSGRI